MKKYITVAALLAAGTAFANAASIGYNSMTDEQKQGLVLASDFNGGNVVGNVPTFTVSNGIASTTGNPWQSITNTGADFTISFDVADISGNAWQTLFSVAGTNAKAQTDEGLLQLQMDGNGMLHLYNTANTDAWGNPAEGTKYFNGATVGGESLPSATNISLGLTKDESTNVFTTLTFVSDSASNTFTAYKNGVQVGQWTNWETNTGITGFQFSQRYGGGRDGADASIDNFGIWNRALSATEVAALVPEPSAFGLLAGLGALALVASRRRRK